MSLFSEWLCNRCYVFHSPEVSRCSCGVKRRFWRFQKNRRSRKQLSKDYDVAALYHVTASDPLGNLHARFKHLWACAEKAKILDHDSDLQAALWDLETEIAYTLPTNPPFGQMVCDFVGRPFFCGRHSSIDSEDLASAAEWLRQHADQAALRSGICVPPDF